ncbi:serpentine type 7TM GPCR chemoreceptor str domain-containing protein [Ditylenchus destructor]|nr:serpentine type 7TM GPCR chemoreceptor str domain-containing protein [Ditylenchus destructor]
MVSPLRQFHDAFQFVVGLLSCVSGSIVVYLLLYRSKAQFRVYSRILLISCVVDLVFGATRMTFAQTVVIRGRIYMMLGGFLDHLPLTWLTILVLLTLYLLFLHVLVMPLQFLFRYLIVCRNRMLKNYQIYATVLVLCLVMLLECTLFGIAFVENNAHLKDKYNDLVNDPIFSDDVPTYIVLDEKKHTLLAYVLLSSLLIIVISSYFLIVYTAIQTLRHLKSARPSMSEQTRKMHDNLTRLLIFQASSPLVLVCIPEILFILAGTLIPNDTMPSGFGLILSMMMSTIPLANSLSTIVIIPNYRKLVHIGSFCMDLFQKV